ncbi:MULTISPECIES: HAD family hydrolase [unclassified Streptomyces]|uniref:HAD family hydrolase n=1 Tax=unclassified Streptomyces TaxID=2593676 RepID=UPI002E221E91|nr:HAD family hydrolase [Streptomyces sp. NBC_01023]
MTIEYVIFDWAGTITPWHTVDLPGIWQDTAAALDGVGSGAERDVGARLLRAERELMTRCRETQCSARLDDVFRLAGVEAQPRALAAYRRSWEAHTVADPRTLKLLAGLRERGMGLGVLSNTLWPAHWHDEIFERDRVLSYIDAAVYSSEVPWTKPHPAIFAAAMSALGASSAAACAFVGDRAFEDVYGAQQAGMRTILLPHSSIPDDELGAYAAVPDAVIGTLQDVVTVVDGWNGVGG